ncbi:hypothetical protein [Phocaeicola vulgatus]|jgi:hypothetical protein|uniref:hypothetical protein n=1 Tax=Phocaeicola vulgatus TaxID=821 RepID=UPI001C3870A8|nr:hypothetical protein [Phocaeicola vulgatus]
MVLYKRMGLAAKDVALSSVAFTGMMLHFCRHSCQILPATLQGRRTGVSGISVPLILQRFTDIVSRLSDTPILL